MHPSSDAVRYEFSAFSLLLFSIQPLLHSLLIGLIVAGETVVHDLLVVTRRMSLERVAVINIHTAPGLAAPLPECFFAVRHPVAMCLIVVNNRPLVDIESTDFIGLLRAQIQ